MSKRRLYLIKWLIAPLLAIVIFGLTQVLNKYPQLVEDYYSQKIYPLLAAVISFFSKWIAVSLDDIFYILLVLTGILILALLLFRKISTKLSGLIVINILAVMYILFYLLWGFNYFRSDINSRLDLISGTLESDEFLIVFSHLVEVTNNSYTSYEETNPAEVDSLIEDSYRKLAPVLKLDYPAGSRRPKFITLSGFFAKAGISGYFGPFFNEVHINKRLLPVEYPFVLAHEKAHQFGITGEAEANFYAWLVCTGSESKKLQYSANLVALKYFIMHGSGNEKTRTVTSKISKQVIHDIMEIQKYWMNLRDEKVEAVAARVNDAYLKTNQIETGIRDYTGIVKHIMDFSLDSAFQQRAGF